MRRHQFNSLAELSQVLIDDVITLLKDAIASRGSAHLMLSGGRTPRFYLAALNQRDIIDWPSVSISFSDERFVSLSHSDSTEGMARETLSGLGAKWHGLRGRTATPHEAALLATQEYSKLAWPADVSLLGMGEDGHIASIFPGHAVDPTVRQIFASKAPNGQDRLSLSPNYLNDCLNPILVIGGKEKRETLERAISKADPSLLPVCHILPPFSSRTQVRIFSHD